MTTRQELLDDANTWLARDDLTSSQDIGTFLRIAEDRITRRIRPTDREVTTQIVATGRTAPLPDDYLSLRSISLDSALDRTIEYLPPERIREAPIWNNRGGGLTDNTAQAYTIEGGNLVFAPAPTAEAPVTFDVVYNASYPRLVNATDTTALLSSNYDLYLYALLQEAAAYVQHVELAGQYSQRFESAVTEYQRSERRKRYSGSALIRTGSPRRVV